MAEIAGWNYILKQTVGSTNDEAKNFCTAENQKTVVRAERQTSGRGRYGRTWISEKGNLFFSLAFEYDLKNLGLLVLISALSLAQTIEKLNSALKPQLKWPNDVLVQNKKISGILLEKGEGNYIIVGIGVNICSAPQNTSLLYDAICLKELQTTCSAEDFLLSYLTIFNQNLILIAENKKRELQNMWLARAAGLGKKIELRQNKLTEEGIFSGIDENMCLLLRQGDNIKKIVVGDVFFCKGHG